MMEELINVGGSWVDARLVLGIECSPPSINCPDICYIITHNQGRIRSYVAADVAAELINKARGAGPLGAATIMRRDGS